MDLNASNREAGPCRRIKQVPYHSPNSTVGGQTLYRKKKKPAKFSRVGANLPEGSGNIKEERIWNKDQILLENAEGSGGRICVFCA